jgi:hypothetical protein
MSHDNARRVVGNWQVVFDFMSITRAEAPPHPEPSLRSDSDLSRKRGEVTTSQRPRLI